MVPKNVPQDSFPLQEVRILKHKFVFLFLNFFNNALLLEEAEKQKSNNGARAPLDAREFRKKESAALHGMRQKCNFKKRNSSLVVVVSIFRLTSARQKEALFTHFPQRVSLSCVKGVL
ncbi:hypothetical protein CEXT_215931 [Caerostris extrusa]|uniref:Uncharacterized protein n=1 Tax=Caerostris extrusa TaxID=172846 RepID=A0AAV4SUR8_CAEEX|nr:hypothetical protein CEXT_215931 [Caerostris extrusa]